MTYTIATNAAGERFIVPNTARNAAGTLFSPMSNSAKNVAGSSFVIFSDPPIETTAPIDKVFTATDYRNFIA